jgi:general secretion pathway protein K
MNRRRGVALLTVLWLLTLLSAVGAGALAVARQGASTSRNRILLLRGAWAREACAEILLARHLEPRKAERDTVELGRGTWCRATVEDAGGRFDLNHAPAEVLRRLIGSDSLADALLDWRDPDDLPRAAGAEAQWYLAQGRRPPRNGPLAGVGELRLVRGFDRRAIGRLDSLLTVRGAPQVDINAAPVPVLAALPGLGPEAVALVLRRRAAGQPVRSSDELLASLSPDALALLTSRFQDYSTLAGYAPSRVMIRVEGGVRGAAPVSAARLTAVPLPGRLAVIRREAE